MEATLTCAKVAACASPSPFLPQNFRNVDFEWEEGRGEAPVAELFTRTRVTFLGAPSPSLCTNVLPFTKDIRGRERAGVRAGVRVGHF